MTNRPAWPALRYDAWKDTLATLHLWTQIVGKVRLTQTPWTNHAWHVPLYTTARGLTTSPIAHQDRIFEMAFDFTSQVLRITTAEGERREIPLVPMTVAAFYEAVMANLRDLDLPVAIHTTPNEIPDAIPFDEDTTHASYDGAAAHDFWLATLQADRVFKAFRARFTGKCSPVHFFWGSFDLAVTRFSGREAPRHPAGVPNMPDWVAREAYSHEVSSAGFWPGGPMHEEAIFYSYAYPSPDGFAQATVGPREARFLDAMGEFILPYEAVRTAPDPDARLLEFLQTTYDAAAELAGWDKRAFEMGDPRTRFQ